MSGTNKDGVDVSRDDNENQIKKPVVTKKYPFQTTKRKNNNNLAKIEESKSETDKSTKDSQIDVSVTQVVNEPMKQGSNLPKIVNETPDRSGEEDPLMKINLENIDNRPPLDQTSETLGENKAGLDLIQVAEKGDKKKVLRKDLTQKEINEICGDKDGKGGDYTKTKTPGLDPRFQQQNQTMRCFVMYTDFYRCENILGEGEFACQWFKDVFTSICPLDWIRRWDEAREEGRLGWTKGKTQGKFPGDRYGV